MNGFYEIHGIYLYIKYILKQVWFWVFTIPSALIALCQRFIWQTIDIPNMVYIGLLILALITAGYKAFRENAPLLNIKISPIEKNIVAGYIDNEHVNFVYRLNYLIRNCGNNPEFIDKIAIESIRCAKSKGHNAFINTIKLKEYRLAKKKYAPWEFGLKKDDEEVYPFAVGYKEPYRRILNLNFEINAINQGSLQELLCKLKYIKFTITTTVQNNRADKKMKSTIKIDCADIVQQIIRNTEPNSSDIS